MANTLTSLIPSLYKAMDIVAREQVGFVPAVTLDASAERVAVNQAILSPVVPAQAAADITPGQLPPDTGDQTIGNTSITISKSRAVPFRWTGEEVKGLNTGAGFQNIRNNQMVQAFRTLINEMEVDLGGLYKKASRATGTAGTTPFATGVGPTAQLLKMMKDNGAPTTDLQLVIDTSAGANLRTNTQLTKANEAGTDATLRRGVILSLHNFDIRESAGINSSTAIGTGASYAINGALAVGATTVACDTGTGTIVAGDVVTIGNYQYVVATALAAGSFTIGAPGLREAVADNATFTVNALAARNMAFHRSSMILLTRAPALPEEGDSAKDRMMIADPYTGMVFEISLYAEYRRVHYEVACAWGVANIKTEFTQLLLG